MPEYVLKQKIIDEIKYIDDEHELFRKMEFLDFLVNQLENIPPEDVEPVVHAKWKTEYDELGWLRHTCTNCGYTKRTDVHVSLDWKRCLNCGAKMDLED